MASSDETYDRHEIMVGIERVGGLEIVDVDYNLMTWGTDENKAEDRLLTAYGLSAGNEPVLWTPQLPSGILSFYNIRTITADEEYISALEGEEIPVPTRTNTYYCDWEPARRDRRDKFIDELHQPAPLPADYADQC